MALAELLPFANNPQDFFLAVAIGVSLLVADEMFFGGRNLSRLMRQNTQDRLEVRGNLMMDVGGRVETVKNINFIGERIVKNEHGSLRTVRAIFYNDLGEKIGVYDDADVHIPLEALSKGEPAILRTREDVFGILANEKDEYERRIATLEAEKSRAWADSLDFCDHITMHAGKWKKEFGATMFMRPSGSGGFSGSAAAQAQAAQMDGGEG